MVDLTKNKILVAHVDDFNDEEMLVFEVDDEEILICRVDNSFHAISNICSHAYVELSDGELDGCFITCPLHFSRFDIRTGEPEGPPAKEAVRVYELIIEEEQIYVKL